MAVYYVLGLSHGVRDCAQSQMTVFKFELPVKRIADCFPKWPVPPLVPRVSCYLEKFPILVWFMFVAGVAGLRFQVQKRDDRQSTRVQVFPFATR